VFVVVPLQKSNTRERIVQIIFGLITVSLFVLVMNNKHSNFQTKPKTEFVAAEIPEDAGKSKNLRIEFSDNFGMTTWYSYFKNLSVKGDTIEVNTFLAENGKDASGICSGISSIVYATRGSTHNETIIVYGSDGSVLIHRNGISEQCR
jgi:hypothetical protein